MLALIKIALSAIGNLFGFGSKVADAQAANTAAASGVTAQVAADQKVAISVQQAELQADAAGRAGPNTPDRMRSGSF